MKTSTIILLIATILAPPFVQHALPQSAKANTATVPVLSQTLNWMIGDWEGEGVQGGSAFASQLSIIPLLDGTVLQLKRASESGLKEMMLLGYDAGAKKYVGVLYDSRNHIGLFSCDLKDNAVDLSQIGLPQGFTSRRVFQMQPDGRITFFIEKAEPQLPLSKSVEITFKKK